MRIVQPSTQPESPSSGRGGYARSAVVWPLVIGVAVCVLGSSVGAQTIEAETVLLRLIDEIDVPARGLGALKEIPVSEGTKVEKGELLAQIDDTEARLEMQRAEFDLAVARYHAEDDVAVRSAERAMQFAEAEYQRLKRAQADQPRSVSDGELEKAKHTAEQSALELEKVQREHDLAQLEQKLAANELELANRMVDIRKVIAPSDGVVENISVRAGEWVKPGDRVLRIVRTDRLRAEGFVSAEDVGEDIHGAEVELVPNLPGKPDLKLSGRVVFVSTEIDPVNGQLQVWANVDNPDGLLRPGLRARMSIRTGNALSSHQ